MFLRLPAYHGWADCNHVNSGMGNEDKILQNSELEFLVQTVLTHRYVSVFKYHYEKS